jgi:hypothetical protein
VEFVEKSVLMTRFNAVSVRSGHMGHVFQWNPKFLMLGQMPIWNSCVRNVAMKMDSSNRSSHCKGQYFFGYLNIDKCACIYNIYFIALYWFQDAEQWQHITFDFVEGTFHKNFRLASAQALRISGSIGTHVLCVHFSHSLHWIVSSRHSSSQTLQGYI